MGWRISGAEEGGGFWGVYYLDTGFEVWARERGAKLNPLKGFPLSESRTSGKWVLKLKYRASMW